MTPYLIAQLPVFGSDLLTRQSVDYLKAAGRDSDNRCVQEISGRLYVQVSSNPEENLYLYGIPCGRKLIEAVQEMGASAFVVDLDPTPTLERRREYQLPFGVSVECGVGSAGVSGALCDQFEAPDSVELEFDRSPGEAASDAIESFLLALAAKGFDLGTPAFEEAFVTAVDSIGQNF